MPDISYDELYIEFDTLVVFSSSSEELTIYNNGTADLVISDISFTSDAFSAFW